MKRALRGYHLRVHSRCRQYALCGNIVLNLQTANAGANNTTFVRHETDASETIATTIVTTKQGAAGTVPFGNSNHTGQAVDNYTLAVTNTAVDATQLAGNYTDRYLIKAYY